jgi:hypothetical protein
MGSTSSAMIWRSRMAISAKTSRIETVPQAASGE